MISYRPEIDGLRAIAVLSVILFHAGVPAVSGGFIGVDVFFVISGFLITSIVLHELADKSFTLMGFYERRVRRILPALFVVIAATTAFAMFWLSPADFMDYGGSVRYLAGFVSNLFFYKTSGYFGLDAELQPLLHTWSLSVEEQYYLAFPPVVLLVWRIRPNWVLPLIAAILIASFGWTCLYGQENPNAAFFLAPYRIWELLAGAAAATAVFKGRVTVTARPLMAFAGILLVLCPLFAFNEETPTPGPLTAIPIIGTVMLLLCATPVTLVGRILATPPLVGIGLVSYSAYLWHQPIFALARHRLLGEPPLEIFLALAVMSLVLAYLTWKFIERPFRNRNWLSRRILFSGAIAGSLLMAGVGLAAKVTGGWMGRTPSEAWLGLQATRQSRDRNVPCWNAFEMTGKACHLGLPDKPPAVALIGDSHAGALSDSISEWLTRIGRGGIDLNYKGCKPFLPEAQSQSTCNRVRERVYGDLSAGALPSVLVVNAAWSSFFAGEGFDNGEGGRDRSARLKRSPDDEEQKRQFLQKSEQLKQSIEAMLNAGHTVVLVYPVPEMGWQVPRQLSKIHFLNERLTAGDASVSHAAFRSRAALAVAALDALGSHPNLIRVKPEDILCDTFAPSRCAAHRDGVALYSDDDHLSNAGGALIVEKIGAALIERGITLKGLEGSP